MRLFILLLALFTLVACDSKEPVKNKPEIGEQIQLPPIIWKIRTDEQMLIVREGSLGRTPNIKVLGLQGVNKSTGDIEVYTNAPKYVDDQVACTLGHEIMHVALGNYHK